ncbi:flavodoxin family protein [Jannaschia sp. CCS1]|uniref:flavodoxin family protein n=1 Tax=Jannaschia sp. (strain CCS1) TaxID=290400 RepID=UPI000053AFF2|nr:flavodoxin family protein [Jannaschia sp. CCS1]ABD53961.1 tryptophan repressor binding protein [Jannaschia sp. CCS1]
MICIPYFSGAGHTALLARAIAEGAQEAHVMDITTLATKDWDALDRASVIVFGAPTYMGSTAARFDQFLEEAAATRWDTGRWRDKLAGGFTVASHGSGDKGVALQRINTYAAQMGMVWVGQAEIGAPVKPDRAGINRDGSWLGLMATSSRDKSVMVENGDLETARHYGARLAMAARRWG